MWFYIYWDEDSIAGAGGDGGGEQVPTWSQHLGYEPTGSMGMIRQVALSSDVISGHLKKKKTISKLLSTSIISYIDNYLRDDWINFRPIWIVVKHDAFLCIFRRRYPWYAASSGFFLDNKSFKSAICKYINVIAFKIDLPYPTARTTIISLNIITEGMRTIYVSNRTQFTRIYTFVVYQNIVFLDWDDVMKPPTVITNWVFHAGKLYLLTHYIRKLAVPNLPFPNLYHLNTNLEQIHHITKFR